MPWLADAILAGGEGIGADDRPPLCKRRKAVNFTRRLERSIDAYPAGCITFAELDASVKGWVNHVRYANTWRLREHVLAGHPYTMQRKE